MTHNTTLKVAGMTCEHCVRLITDELTSIHGVSGVRVELVKGGASPVTVSSEHPLGSELIKAAVNEAGYEVVS